MHSVLCCSSAENRLLPGMKKIKNGKIIKAQRVQREIRLEKFYYWKSLKCDYVQAGVKE